MYDQNDVWFKPKKFEPKSPCKNECSISSQTGLCSGCFCTLKEIVDWETATLGERGLILERVEERRKRSEVQSPK